MNKLKTFSLEIASGLAKCQWCRVEFYLSGSGKFPLNERQNIMKNYAATAIILTVVTLFSTAGTTAENASAASAPVLVQTTFSYSGSAGDIIPAI